MAAGYGEVRVFLLSFACWGGLWWGSIVGLSFAAARDGGRLAVAAMVRKAGDEGCASSPVSVTMMGDVIVMATFEQDEFDIYLPLVVRDL